MNTIERPATASEIVAICGQLDDGVVAHIVATGATVDDVLEALTWCDADDQIGTELSRGRRGAVNAVYEILMREERDRDDER